jgi:hypothetical protein
MKNINHGRREGGGSTPPGRSNTLHLDWLAVSGIAGTRRDKSEAFHIVKPLHGTGRHVSALLSN